AGGGLADRVVRDEVGQAGEFNADPVADVVVDAELGARPRSHGELHRGGRGALLEALSERVSDLVRVVGLSLVDEDLCAPTPERYGLGRREPRGVAGLLLSGGEGDDV